MGMNYSAQNIYQLPQIGFQTGTLVASYVGFDIMDMGLHLMWEMCGN